MSTYCLASRLMAAALALTVAAPPTALLAQTSGGQNDVYVETVNVELVNIDVYVRDGDGKPVNGLTADDFELSVDGQAAPISNFYAIEDGEERVSYAKQSAVPDELPEPDSPAARVIAQEQTPSKPLDQRLHVVCYIDNFNLTPFSRNRVLRELREFLREELSPDDQVMLATYDRSLNLRQPFTNRPENVARALLELEDISAQRIHQNSDRLDAMKVIEDADSFQIAWSEAENWAMKVRNDTEFTIEALRSVVDNLAGTSGRKALIYVADGLPMIAAEEAFYGVRMVFPDQMSLLRLAEFDLSRQFQELAAQANANRVSFYAVDARGLTVLSQSQVDYDIAGQAMERTLLDQITNANLQSSFQLLAEETGGRAILNTNRYLPDLKRVSQDFRSYYSIGYQSPTPYDGRYHRFKVKLKDKKRGWSIRHRSGYRDKTVESRMHDGTLSALNLNLQENELEAKLIFGPQTVRSDGLYSVPIRLVVPFKEIVMIPQQGVHRGNLRMWFAAKDEEDKMSEVQQIPLPIAFPSERAQEALTKDYIYDIELTMEPGYQDVAVGVHDVLGGTKVFLRRGVQVGRRQAGM